LDEEVVTLESVIPAANKWNLPENAQRPCITSLYESDLTEGVRNKSFHILACDLINRQNKGKEQVEDILLEKNTQLSNPISQKEIKSIVKSAAKKKFNNKTYEYAGITYGCNNEPIILGHCIGKDICPYYKQSFIAKGSRRDQEINSSLDIRHQGPSALVNKGWLNKLSGSGFKVYCAIWRLEKIKRIRPGSILIVTHREIATASGLCRQIVAESLKTLHFETLIKYKKGKQHLRYKTASEIMRIIPIPEVTKRQIISLPHVNKITTIKDIKEVRRMGIRV